MYEDVFNAATYMVFLETTVSQFFEKGKRLFYIQDNTSYHKDKDVWSWFRQNRDWIEVHNLPPYCPELNATEALWKHTRQTGTHNRTFSNTNEIITTLDSVFEKMNTHPAHIAGYLRPFL